MEISSFLTDFENLPKKIQKQVLDYVEFLISKHRQDKNKTNKFRFNWENGLSDLKNEYSSVELQHKASELR